MLINWFKLPQNSWATWLKKKKKNSTINQYIWGKIIESNKGQGKNSIIKLLGNQLEDGQNSRDKWDV